MGLGIVGREVEGVEVACTALARHVATVEEAIPRDMMYIQKESEDHIP